MFTTASSPASACAYPQAWYKCVVTSECNHRAWSLKPGAAPAAPDDARSITPDTKRASHKRCTHGRGQSSRAGDPISSGRVWLPLCLRGKHRGRAAALLAEHKGGTTQRTTPLPPNARHRRHGHMRASSPSENKRAQSSPQAQSRFDPSTDAPRAAAIAAAAGRGGRQPLLSTRLDSSATWKRRRTRSIRPAPPLLHERRAERQASDDLDVIGLRRSRMTVPQDFPRVETARRGRQAPIHRNLLRQKLQ